MTHLSDFSFLQRAICISYLFVWYIYRVYKVDKFKCFSLSRVRQGELKSIVSILMLFMIPAQLYYDIATCIIKYQEGFAEIFGHIFTKPDSQWSAASKLAVIPASYSLCIGFSFQTGTLLLLQCFWNYLANSVAKTRFMSSKEFKFYIGWTIVSMIIFPVLQYNFSREVYSATLKEAVPQLVYGCELLIVSLLGVHSHSRFQKLLHNSRESNNTRATAHRIVYFQELNMILAIALLIDSLSMIILSADGLTGKKYLNSHKFSADLLICNINITSIVVWFIVILIFHPAPTLPVSPLSGPSYQHGYISTHGTRPPKYGITQIVTQDTTRVSSGYYSKSEHGSTSLIAQPRRPSLTASQPITLAVPSPQVQSTATLVSSPPQPVQPASHDQNLQRHSNYQPTGTDTMFSTGTNDSDSDAWSHSGNEPQAKGPLRTSQLQQHYIVGMQLQLSGQSYWGQPISPGNPPRNYPSF